MSGWIVTDFTFLEAAIAEDLRSLMIFPVADGPGRSKRAELRIWIFWRMCYERREVLFTCYLITFLEV